MRKASATNVQRGGGRRSKDEDGNIKVDRSNWPAQYGHHMANHKPFQLAANWLLQGLLKPFMPAKKEAVLA